jgi:zinc D-Ala-D-Ala carboxypeptidase
MRFSDEFVEAVDAVRQKFYDATGQVLRINSGYRCPAHNAEVSADNSFDGPHTLMTGAVDFECYGDDANTVLFIVYRDFYPVKIHGIFINQRGNFGGRFVHLDKAPNIPGKRPRPWCGTY